MDPQPGQEATDNLLQPLFDLLRAGQHQRLEAHARAVLQLHPDSGAAWKFLGLALRAQGKDDRAAWQAAVGLLPGDAEAHYNLGDAYRAAHQLPDAAACYQRVLVIDPDAFGAYLNLGMLLQQFGHPDLAETQYRHAIRIKPDLPEAHFNLALVHKQLGRLEDAEAGLRQAIRLRSNFLAAYGSLGSTLIALGKPGEAATIGRHLIEAADAFYLQGNLQAAEAFGRQALQFCPDDADAYRGLGITLLRVGHQGEAEFCFRKALQIKPDFPDLHHQRGWLLFNLGRRDEALTDFARAMKHAPPWQARLSRLTDPWVKLDGLVLAGASSKAHAVASGSAGVATTAMVRSTPVQAPLRRADLTLPPAPRAGGRLRIVLIYPPPWQIPSAGDDPVGMPYGAPRDRRERELFDGDFATIPYGVLTLAAQAKRSGHEVSVFNLVTTPWREVSSLLAGARADVFGLSAFAANRRGLGAVATLIRQLHPDAHIVAGGPFVTALPGETLQHYRDIDTAVIGEGEETFMELLERLGAGLPTAGIAGSAWRNGDEIVVGPARPRIRDLDALASPFDYFTSPVVMTSRGCPSHCSFCGSFATWGKKLRFHSVEGCINLFGKALSRQTIPFIAIKDDTFTAHRKRALAICDAIIDRKMNFLWSCDTRVDSLDEELLCRMRRAGCERISLGIESGSPEILTSIHKDSTPEAALEVTRLARKYGIQVRYYLIIGNRGETPATVQQSIDLIRAGRPGFAMFSILGFFPGTEEWEILRRQTGATTELFFANDFKELNVATHRRPEWDTLLLQIQADIGTYGFGFSVAEREAVCRLIPEVPSTHVDLACACLKSGRLDEAERALDQATALGYPIPAIVENQRAGVALARGDIDRAFAALDRATRHLDHPIIRNNRQLLSIWANSPATLKNQLPVLNMSIEAPDFLS